MLVFKDKTFCKVYRQCKLGKICHRALTPQIKKEAILKGLPVAMFIGTPNCFEPKKKNGTTN